MFGDCCTVVCLFVVVGCFAVRLFEWFCFMWVVVQDLFVLFLIVPVYVACFEFCEFGNLVLIVAVVCVRRVDLVDLVGLFCLSVF